MFLTHCAKRQAYKLFGAVDFLGNPLGLAHDIKEGFNGVMKHGDFTHVIQGIEFVFSYSTLLILIFDKIFYQYIYQFEIMIWQITCHILRVRNSLMKWEP